MELTRMMLCRGGGDVRRGVRAVAGGALPADVRAASGGAAAPAGGGAADVCGELPGPPRRDGGHQGRRHQGRRLPPHLRRLEEPGRALLSLARRLPPVRGHQGTVPSFSCSLSLR
jgi:hypothetical protein